MTEATLRLPNLNIPDIASKSLKLRKSNGQKRLTISSNLLPMFDFKANANVVEKAIGAAGQGFKIEVAEKSSVSKKVYQRKYNSSNRLEAQLEISRKDLIEGALASAEKVRVYFQQGVITVLPILDLTQQALKNVVAAIKSGVKDCVAMLSSGVDASLVEKAGFSIRSLLDYRPHESRDKHRDLSETGITAAMANVKAKHIFNEDLYSLLDDYEGSPSLKAMQNATLLIVSPQCDDFSNAKSKTLKEASVDELSSTADMTIVLAEAMRRLRPATLLVENVPNYFSSDLFQAFDIQMRRMGYKSFNSISEAHTHGGYTRRKRGFAFYTLFGDVPFSFPEKSMTSPEALWDLVEEHLPECRDVTDSKSLNKGKEVGRLRAYRQGDAAFPTILKSQSRMCKDTAVIEHEDRLYYPSIDLMKALQGIEHYDLSAGSKDIATEILGQSICGIHYRGILENINNHIENVKKQYQ